MLYVVLDVALLYDVCCDIFCYTIRHMLCGAMFLVLVICYVIIVIKYYGQYVYLF